MEMLCLQRILHNGQEFWLVGLRNVQTMLWLPFFHVMTKWFISLMLWKRKSQKHMSVKLCAPNGMVIFCWLMGQNFHSINVQDCMVMHGLTRMEHTRWTVRYVLLTISVIQILTRDTYSLLLCLMIWWLWTTLLGILVVYMIHGRSRAREPSRSMRASLGRMNGCGQTQPIHQKHGPYHHSKSPLMESWVQIRRLSTIIFRR